MKTSIFIIETFKQNLLINLKNRIMQIYVKANKKLEGYSLANNSKNEKYKQKTKKKKKLLL